MRKELKQLNCEKKVLITGAAGFIGFHLSRSLLEKQIEVIGFDNLNDYYDINLKMERLNILNKYTGYTFIKGDISEKQEIEKIFTEYPVDIVINLAAQAGVRYSITNPDEYIKSNIVGFYNVLECCRNYKIEHLVFASSSSVYGANTKIPFSTNDNVDRPVSLYAATKKSNELIAYSYSHLYKIPVTGLRFFTVYGPFGRPDMAYYSFTDAITKEKPIKIFNNGDMYRDFTYIDDIVEGMERIIPNPPKNNGDGIKYKIYNIGNNKPIKIMDFISLLEKFLNKNAMKEFHPMQQGDVFQTYADIDDIINDFGFRPVTTIEKGLEKFVKWYKER